MQYPFGNFNGFRSAVSTDFVRQFRHMQISICEGSDWIVLGTQRLMEYKSWQSGKYDFIFEFPSRPTLDQLTGSLDNAVATAVTNEYEAEFGADGRLAQERGLTGIP